MLQPLMRLNDNKKEMNGMKSLKPIKKEIAKLLAVVIIPIFSLNVQAATLQELYPDNGTPPSGSRIIGTHLFTDGTLSTMRLMDAARTLGQSDPNRIYEFKALNGNWVDLLSAAQLADMTTYDMSTFTSLNITHVNGSDSITVAVQSISLNQSSLSLTVGGAGETLTATVLPESATNKTYAWSSSDSGVATVNNGLVSPVSAGTATITVTTTDGNQTATCAVTVERAAGASIETSAEVSGNPTENSISISPATLSSSNPGSQSVEYAISTNNSTEPSSGWQDAMTFTGLSANTTYYVWARAKATDNYNAGTAVSSAGITTAEAIISINSITFGSITAPVLGETPNTTYTPGNSESTYSGSVAWSGSPDTFEAGVPYTATITLTAEANHEFKSDFSSVDVSGLTNETSPISSVIVTRVSSTQVTIAITYEAIAQTVSVSLGALTAPEVDGQTGAAVSIKYSLTGAEEAKTGTAFNTPVSVEVGSTIYFYMTSVVTGTTDGNDDGTYEKSASYTALVNDVEGGREFTDDGTGYSCITTE